MPLRLKPRSVSAEPSAAAVEIPPSAAEPSAEPSAAEPSAEPSAVDLLIRGCNATNLAASRGGVPHARTRC